MAHGHVVIAHRFAWAVAHGAHELDRAMVLAHRCDEPLCQSVPHLHACDAATNAAEWAQRRMHFAGHLADARPARERAQAIRASLLDGQPLPHVLAAQRTELKRNQLCLF